jgi:Zn-dependent membrane protease YugP
MYDYTYWIFMIPAFLLTTIAQMWVSSTYKRWSNVHNSLSVDGASAAQKLLVFAGLSDVGLKGTTGILDDHYDPTSNTLALSQAVAQVPSVAALAITAHEIGHAMQDKEGYGPMRMRSALVPVANIGSSFGWILLVVGLVLGWTGLGWLGVILFSVSTLLMLATVPVELNASSRARELLDQAGLVQTDEERDGVKSMLRAAAFTYVAALASSILQLLRFVTLLGGGRRRS